VVKRRILTMVLCAILVLAMTAPMVSARAATFTETEEFDLTGLRIENVCSDRDEFVRITGGTLKQVFHITADAAGGFHLVVHNNFTQVTGVGLTSGDAYRFQGSNTQELYARGPFPFESNLIANGILINKESGGVQHGETLIHLTVNANGEVTAELVSFRVDCRG
jgi:hypothetical protein